MSAFGSCDLVRLRFVSESARVPIVPDGLRYHRFMVRRNGPLLGLAIPFGCGLLALVLLVGSESTWRGVMGFVFAIMALPTLPLVGIPVMGGAVRWLLAIASSAVVWSVIGFVAARRSTRRVATSWPEWRREWGKLAVGVWAGALLGIGIAAGLLSVSL